MTDNESGLDLLAVAERLEDMGDLCSDVFDAWWQMAEKEEAKDWMLKADASYIAATILRKVHEARDGGHLLAAWNAMDEHAAFADEEHEAKWDESIAAIRALIATEGEE